jgi:hypothetical protein
MPKKVPQRRNKLAGTGTPASAKKKAYDTKYHATKERKLYRARLNRANRLKPNKKGVDKSHTKGGKLTNERRSTNRARQGKGGRSTKR